MQTKIDFNFISRLLVVSFRKLVQLRLRQFQCLFSYQMGDLIRVLLESAAIEDIDHALSTSLFVATGTPSFGPGNL